MSKKEKILNEDNVRMIWDCVICGSRYEVELWKIDSEGVPMCCEVECRYIHTTERVNA